MNNMISNYDWSMCTSSKCKDKDHRNIVDRYVTILIQILQNSGKLSSAAKKHNIKGKAVNGWNQFVKNDYLDDRRTYLQWVCNKNC